MFTNIIMFTYHGWLTESPSVKHTIESQSQRFNRIKDSQQSIVIIAYYLIT
jgi:hypothetical protein